MKTDIVACRNPSVEQFARHHIRSNLMGIAIRAATEAGIPKPSRDEKRTKKGMIAWFDRHWDRIKDISPLIEIGEPSGDESTDGGGDHHEETS